MARRFSWARLVVHGSALALVALALGGCPRECEEEREVTLVPDGEDPALGVFEGPLDWLQTGERTTVTLTVTADATSVGWACDGAQVETDHAVESLDGVVSYAGRGQASVSTAGLVLPESRTIPLDAAALIGAGKVPDAPGIGERSPQVTLSLVPDLEGGWMATIVIRSASDHLTVGAGTLSRAR